MVFGYISDMICVQIYLHSVRHLLLYLLLQCLQQIIRYIKLSHSNQIAGYKRGAQSKKNPPFAQLTVSLCSSKIPPCTFQTNHTIPFKR